jgi:hypothetical protein
MRRAAALLATVVLGLAACDSPPDDALTSCQDSFVLPAAVETDILFVIDDSGSMAEEQADVSAALTTFVQALDASPVANDYQIGVTNTSVTRFDPEATTTYTTYAGGVNDGLAFPAGRLIAVDASGAYSYTSGPRIVSPSSGTFIEDFQRNVLVGTDGSGKEQPFLAARLALEAAGPGGANDGFLRQGARLAVIFISDEDDCTDPDGVISTEAGQGGIDCHDPAKKGLLEPVGDLASFLRGPLAGETRDVVVAAIAGLDTSSLAPSCGGADPSCGAVNAWCEPAAATRCDTACDRADRLVALLDAFGVAATVRDSICDASFADSLAAIAGLIVPDTMPLEGAPADWRMLVVTVSKAAGATVPCEVAPDGPAIPPTADAIYTPPLEGRPATLTFQGECALAQGDRVDLRIVCAG